jgi:DNA/RNA-binding domain of Phe-tRNA-synthetase-like protein
LTPLCKLRNERFRHSQKGVALFNLSDNWKTTYPNAHVGVLAMRDVINPSSHAELEQRKIALEQDLRSRYADQDRAALTQLPVLQAYAAYYRHFKKTYHVQLQLESIVFKGKSIPSVAALVEAMFMAEIKNLLLTAGHDLDLLQLPLTVDVSHGEERYTLLRGQEQELKAEDMFILDGAGVISSIIYGPDQRTAINAPTRNVVFTVYAPDGIAEETVASHLHDLRANVLLVAPDAHTELLQVFGAR